MEKRQIKIKETCKGQGHDSITRECEEEGLASKSASARKMAQLSKNSRSWNKGGK